MPPDTPAFSLTYTGTLAVALLMFLGQLAAFTALLALAGTARLLASAVRWMRRPTRQANPSATSVTVP